MIITWLRQLFCWHGHIRTLYDNESGAVYQAECLRCGKDLLRHYR